MNKDKIQKNEKKTNETIDKHLDDVNAGAKFADKTETTEVKDAAETKDTVRRPSALG